MPRTKKGGGTEMQYPDMSKIDNIANLSFSTDRYQDFDYSKHLDSVRLSNFTAGGIKHNSRKKLDRFLKQAYLTYMQGGNSTINLLRQQRGGFSDLKDLTVSIKDVKNTAGLLFNEPYKTPVINHLSEVPQSNFFL